MDFNTMRDTLIQRLRGAEAGYLANVETVISGFLRQIESRFGNNAKDMVVTIGNTINEVILRSSTSLVHVTATQNGASSATTSSPASRCAFVIAVDFTSYTVQIRKGPLYSSIVKHDQVVSALKNPTEAVAKIQGIRDSVLYAATGKIIESLLEYISLTRQFSEGTQNITDTMPGTLGNLMLVRALVGSSIAAVGRPGLTMLRTQLEEAGRNAIYRAAAFQSGYIYPSIKVYFIEEDDEAYYLFDDLYSYSSIVSVDIHYDSEQATEVCLLQCTNIMGHLTNMMADRLNTEMNFLRGPDENAPLNAIMLRPGTKIKIQMGNTPVLTEKDTAFTGRIVSVVPGEIVQIEAQSHGKSMLEDMSMDKMKIYSAHSQESTDVLGRVWGKIKDTVKQAVAGIFDTVDTAVCRPVDTIKDIIGYVLGDMRTTLTSLSDYSINPAANAEIDGDLQEATRDLSQAIKDKLVPGLSRKFAQRLGVDVGLAVNTQLFENIHIQGDTESSGWFLPVPDPHEGSWVSVDDTAWDILNDINLLLPNNIVTVRPYDTRGTLVWGGPESYYRYRRTVDVKSIMANAVIRKIIGIVDSASPKCDALYRFVSGSFQSGDPKARTSAIALGALVSYYAQLITYGYDKSMVTPTEWVDFTSPDGIARGMSWIYMFEGARDISLITRARNAIQSLISGTDNSSLSILTYVRPIVQKAHRAIREIVESNDTFSDNVGRIPMADLVSEIGDVSSTKDVVKAMAIEFASQLVFTYMLKLVQSQSTSHRKISEIHLKLSGRDIVHNDIQLCEPYNTVQLTVPPGDVETDELNADFLIPTMSRSGPFIFPAHYTLKPWSWKTYSSFFRNVNVFPSARASSITMSATSILANCLSQAYDGTLTILGDASIRDHDRILMWDRTRDMFGLVGVRKHTISFKADTGCISTIVPKMIVRNDFSIESTTMETLFWHKNIIMNSILTGGLVAAGYMGSRRIWKMLKLRGLAASTEQSALQSAMRRITSFMEQRQLLQIANMPLSRIASHHETELRAAVRELTAIKDTMHESMYGKKTVTAIRNILHEITPTEQHARLSDQAIRTIMERTMKSTLNAFQTNRSSSRSLRNLRELFIVNAMDEILASRAMRNVTITRGSDQWKKLQITIEEMVPLEGAASFISGTRNTNALRRVIENNTGISSADKSAMLRELDALSDYFLYDISTVGKWMKLFTGGALAYMTADWTLDTGRDIIDIYLTTGMGSNNITITPLFFRGEPFIAGLEGMTKKDGERAGFADVMKARFSNLVEGVSHAFTDPVLDEVYRFRMERSRIGRIR